MKKNFFSSGKTRWLILGVLVLAIAGGGYYYYSTKTRSRRTTAVTVAPVQTATAFRGNIILQASGTGTLIAANQISFGLAQADKSQN